ncbi:putative DnaJ domain, Chaperone J-domain superfamily [Helianthus annuus]|nr:putative DnaJ domain, Chaperone J-domain superfamily [Helianthus annuus]
MECNKDEAHRAKKIAEAKMVKNDFEGARKFALKAKQLYPELDNISQLVTVCDVHCAAQKKIYGAEKDLYGILQVENVADDTTIRKQYRKLALVLHPDKNKFPGAESAFKLIGEANMTLSDRGKRSIYDMKCREPAKASATKIHNHQGYQTSYAGQQNKFKRAPSSQFNGVSHGQQSTSNPSIHLTFWTYCPFCSVKYEYYREFIQRPLRCQQCSKLFIAYEIGPQERNINLGSKAQSVNPGSKPVSQQKETAKVENAKGNIKKDGKVPSNLERKKTEGTRMNQKGVTKPKVSGVRKPMETGTAKATDKKRRKRMAAESREASSDKKEAAGGGVSGGSPNGKRSSRHRQQASYQEGGAGEFSPSKKSKLSKSSGDVAHADVSTPNGKLKQNGKEVVTPDSHSKNDPEPELVDCPEQDFTNFDKDKEEHCFAVGQIWACYDSVDAMPRFYAQIKKVYSSKFRLRIAWFESDPDNVLEIKWIEEGLPVACGKYELGETEETSNRLMFSHQMVIKKVSKSSYFISPQKGEIWAVYKDWDMKWSMDPENHTKYKFDIGEIVEAGEDCITVGFLSKVKGFVSVFQRSMWAGAGDQKIPCNERFRFSHRIPSAKLTGTERAGVPAGSFELDMASLPADFEEYCSYSSNNVNTASKSHEETVKPVPNLVRTPKKRIDMDSPLKLRRSPRGLGNQKI